MLFVDKFCKWFHYHCFSSIIRWEMSKMEQIFESFLESVPYTYFTHLKAFKDYLRHLKVTDDTIIDFLQGVRTERIIDSLKFNIENRSQSKKKF